MDDSIYEIPLKKIDGSDATLAEFKGRSPWLSTSLPSAAYVPVRRLGEAIREVQTSRFCCTWVPVKRFCRPGACIGVGDSVFSCLVPVVIR